MLKLKLALAAGVVACLVAAAVIGGATPADAAGLRNPPPPGAGWVWGAPLASLQRADCRTVEEAGGWDGGQHQIFSSGSSSPSSFPPIGMLVRLAEPCYVPAAGNGSRIRLSGEMYSAPTNTTPTSSQSTFDGAPGTAGIVAADWYLRCATSEWSKTATIRTHNGTGGIGGSGPSAAESGTPKFISANVQGFTAWGTGITDAQCPYVISATGKFCGYYDNGDLIYGGDAPLCRVVTWWAEEWFAQVPYNFAPWDEAICTVDITVSSDCVYILPDLIDGTNFDSACQGMYTFVPPGWANFADWIPDLVAWWQTAIGHYARCLFVPINGWDAEGDVEQAWATSSFTEAVALLEDATAAFTFTESCGVIVDYGTVDSFTGATGGVNTCDWAGWGSTVRTGIGIILTLGFAWWAIQFVVVTLTALFRAVPMIDPMTYADIIHNSPPPGGD